MSYELSALISISPIKGGVDSLTDQGLQTKILMNSHLSLSMVLQLCFARTRAWKVNRVTVLNILRTDTLTYHTKIFSAFTKLAIGLGLRHLI